MLLTHAQPSVVEASARGKFHASKHWHEISAPGKREGAAERRYSSNKSPIFGISTATEGCAAETKVLNAVAWGISV